MWRDEGWRRQQRRATPSLSLPKLYMVSGGDRVSKEDTGAFNLHFLHLNVVNPVSLPATEKFSDRIELFFVCEWSFVFFFFSAFFLRSSYLRILLFLCPFLFVCLFTFPSPLFHVHLILFSAPPFCHLSFVYASLCLSLFSFVSSLFSEK